MRKTGAAVAAVTFVALLLAVPGASAATCSYPASAYGSPPSAGAGPTNDPLSAAQWGLTQIKAPAAWARGAQGAGAVVAVLDTGADLTHPDLTANLVAGVDLDKGIPDPTPPDPVLPPGGECAGPQDENGHGTHVSGIIAAVTNNGTGVAGVAPQAKVMPVRVLDARGEGTSEAIVEGIHYAADHGAKVINMSLGGAPIYGETPAFNQDFEDAVAYAYSKGVVVVGAAGNESLPLCSYPAAAKNALCVAATDPNGLPSYYSNFPADPDGTVAVRAPGGSGTFFCEDDIYSTYWPGAQAFCSSAPGYEALAGSSMAAPHAAGLAALLSAKGLSAAQILECIRTTSSNKGTYDPVRGYGIIDADAATKTCTAAGTASFTASSTGGSGGTTSGSTTASGLSVRVRRTTRAALARTGRLKVVVSSTKPVTVGLRALFRRSRTARRHTAARRTVRLSAAGTRTFTLKLDRATRRGLLRYRRSSLVVRYRSGTRAGTARAA
jgi:serine protease